MNAPLRTVHGLYAITHHDPTAATPLADTVTAAIRGGTRMVQYRDKSADHARRMQEAQTLLAMCHAHEVPLIINDDVALAAELDADGVHLGRNDATLEEARVQLGPHAIIGVSCYDSMQRAVAAEQAGADYVAFGSFYPSPTKPHAARAPLSLLPLARSRLSVPICCIGGITAENGTALIEAGADMLAIISGLFARANVESAARRYAQLFK